jgi:hypothetical protein
LAGCAFNNPVPARSAGQIFFIFGVGVCCGLLAGLSHAMYHQLNVVKTARVFLALRYSIKELEAEQSGGREDSTTSWLRYYQFGNDAYMPFRLQHLVLKRLCI